MRRAFGVAPAKRKRMGVPFITPAYRMHDDEPHHLYNVIELLASLSEDLFAAIEDFGLKRL
jgi:hypothetical protein